MSNSRFHPMSEAYLSIYEGKKRGLWDNIHAKRKRGEAPAKKGDKDYPETLNVEEVETVDEGLTGARAQRAREMQDTTIKKGGGVRTNADRDTAFRLGTGTGPGRVGDRPIKSQNRPGRGNAAKRRMGEELETEQYEVTNADKKGNTQAYKNFKAGKKKPDGTPMYRAAAHMKESSLKQARKNVGASTCWDGYKAQGTKKKGGKSVPNCVKEDYIDYLLEKRFAADVESAEVMYLHMSDRWKQVIDEESYDAMKDSRMMRGGVDGNNRYDRQGGGANTAGKKPSLAKGNMDAFDAVVKNMKAKYGDKAIMAKKTTKK